MHGRVVSLMAGLLASTVVLAGCPVKKAAVSPRPTPKTGDARYETPVPTVTPSPAGAPAALPTRPLPNPNIKGTKGKPVGPIITHVGMTRADGTVYQPDSVDAKGVATYKTPVGSGFILVVESKQGLNNYEVGRNVFAFDADDPSKQPDLQLVSDHPLGDGSEAVCDNRRPDIGGVPAIKPPSFEKTKRVSNALNDMACRFEVFIESGSSCTMGKNGDASFINPESTTQFCMLVARAWGFPVGTTTLNVRVRDVDGNPGPVKQVKIYHPAEPPRPKKTPPPAGSPKPKALPTRSE